MTHISPLLPADRVRWAELWEAYLAFYKTTLPNEMYDLTWARLQGGALHGLGARRADGQLIGITHYLYHASTWAAGPVCYLQDLFVDEAARGTGAGRLLIEGVADAARAAGSARLYWLTQHDNVTARQLYDRLAQNRGFIRYDYAL